MLALPAVYLLATATGAVLFNGRAGEGAASPRSAHAGKTVFPESKRDLALGLAPISTGSDSRRVSGDGLLVVPPRGVDFYRPAEETGDSGTGIGTVALRDSVGAPSGAAAGRRVSVADAAGPALAIEGARQVKERWATARFDAPASVPRLEIPVVSGAVATRETARMPRSDSSAAALSMIPGEVLAALGRLAKPGASASERRAARRETADAAARYGLAFEESTDVLEVMQPGVRYDILSGLRQVRCLPASNGYLWLLFEFQEGSKETLLIDPSRYEPPENRG